MEKKITLKEFWNSDKHLAIHCDTEKKANELLKAFDKMGKKWNSGSAYLACVCWDLFEDDTCYDNNHTYGDIDDFDTVYEFEEVDLDECTEDKTMTDLFQEMKDLTDKFFEKANAMLGIKEEKVWEFTEEEKVILRNIPKEYKYIARNDPCLYDDDDDDGDNSLYAYKDKPIKRNYFWDSDYKIRDLALFNHIFKDIKWEDEEPCEFRKYI